MTIVNMVGGGGGSGYDVSDYVIDTPFTLENKGFVSVGVSDSALYTTSYSSEGIFVREDSFAMLQGGNRGRIVKTDGSFLTITTGPGAISNSRGFSYMLSPDGNSYRAIYGSILVESGSSVNQLPSTSYTKTAMWFRDYDHVLVFGYNHDTIEEYSYVDGEWTKTADHPITGTPPGLSTTTYLGDSDGTVYLNTSSTIYAGQETEAGFNFTGYLSYSGDVGRIWENGELMGFTTGTGFQLLGGGFISIPLISGDMEVAKYNDTLFIPGKVYDVGKDAFSGVFKDESTPSFILMNNELYYIASGDIYGRTFVVSEGAQAVSLERLGFMIE